MVIDYMVLTLGYKGGGIGAAMATPLFSSNMGHALWPRLNWLSIRAARYGTDVYAHELMVRLYGTPFVTKTPSLQDSVYFTAMIYYEYSTRREWFMNN